MALDLVYPVQSRQCQGGERRAAPSDKSPSCQHESYITIQQTQYTAEILQDRGVNQAEGKYIVCPGKIVGSEEDIFNIFCFSTFTGLLV